MAYSVHCTLYSVQCTLYSVRYVVFVILSFLLACLYILSFEIMYTCNKLGVTK